MNGRRHFGFSLLEMTLVILILSLFAGMYLSYQVSASYEERVSLTNTRLEAVQKALLNFRRVNHRIPCPAVAGRTLADIGYGLEDDGASCAGTLTGVDVAIGAVPAKTLGLLDENMYDGWGRKFTYAVDPRAAADCSTTTYTITDTSVGLRVDDEDLSDAIYRTDSAWYVLLSHGQNGHGAFLTGAARFTAASTNDSEQLNCHCDSAGAASPATRVFVERPRQETAGEITNRYDDLTRFETRINLRSREEETGHAESCP